MRAGCHELITGPMKFNAGFPQPFLNVHSLASLGGSLSSPRSRSPLGLFLLPHAELTPNSVETFCLAPNLPNQSRVSTIPRPRVLCLFLYLCLSPKNQWLLIFLRGFSDVLAGLPTVGRDRFLPKRSRGSRF